MMERDLPSTVVAGVFFCLTFLLGAFVLPAWGFHDHGLVGALAPLGEMSHVLVALGGLAASSAVMGWLSLEIYRFTDGPHVLGALLVRRAFVYDAFHKYLQPWQYDLMKDAYPILVEPTAVLYQDRAGPFRRLAVTHPHRSIYARIQIGDRALVDPILIEMARHDHDYASDKKEFDRRYRRYETDGAVRVAVFVGSALGILASRAVIPYTTGQGPPSTTEAIVVLGSANVILDVCMWGARRHHWRDATAIFGNGVRSFCCEHTAILERLGTKQRLPQVVDSADDARLGSQASAYGDGQFELVEGGADSSDDH